MYMHTLKIIWSDGTELLEMLLLLLLLLFRKAYKLCDDLRKNI